MIAVLSLLTASATAVQFETRSSEDVTFVLSNDQSGAYASVNFPADGLDKSVESLFASTPIGSSGQILASSAQLSQFPGSINCVLEKYGSSLATFTTDHTFVDLDGNPSTAFPVNLDQAHINCHT